MSIHIILQARTSSTRLPNKVLKQILDKPMLEHQLLRLIQLKRVDNLIVATSDDKSDDAIAVLCDALNINCFRGNLNNVLDRYYQAHQRYPSQHIIRITGDCPVIDIDIINRVIDLHLRTGADYSSNCAPSTLPDGLDVEIFTADALLKTWQQAKKLSELEHVTLFMRSHPTLFNCQNYLHPVDYSHLRWTVDEPEDFQLITEIFNNLYPTKAFFNLADILALIGEKPELMHINSNFKRNEGLLKSLRADNNLINHSKE
jgi:spore coat polysaccharide biosynthesis protein SpsF